MAAGKERACTKKCLFLKPSDLIRPIHYHENSTGKTLSHDSIISLQDEIEIWVGTQSQTISLSNSFYEVSITHLSKTDKDITRKANYRISLISIDAKNLNKMDSTIY